MASQPWAFSGREAWSWTKSLASIAAIVIGWNTVAWAQFDIPSESMVPTLKVGDRFAVAKFSYGYSSYSLPFGLDRLVPASTGRIFGSAPARGDIVVFAHPTTGVTFVKRAIGLPGDRIAIRAGRVILNGEVVERTKLRDVMVMGRGGVALRVAEYKETLPGGRTHLIRERTDTEAEDTLPEQTIPPGHYFMMGDNRDNSSDSRVWGPVPEARLIGRGDFMTLSFADCEEIGSECGWRAFTGLR